MGGGEGRLGLGRRWWEGRELITLIDLLEECLDQCWQSEKVFSSSAAEESETEPYIRTYNTGSTLSVCCTRTHLSGRCGCCQLCYKALLNVP